MKTILFTVVLPLVLFANVSAFAQQRSMPVKTDDESGFQVIFDGETLNDWEGDTNYWRVANGCLVGEVTPDNLLSRNSFIVWQGGAPRDFELKVDYRVSGSGNSGINYRSVMATNFGPWAMRGYQADIDGKNQYTGQNYEEKGRTFLALRSQITRIVADKPPEIIGSLGSPDELVSAIRADDWNEYHLVVSGNVLTHIVNGRVMSVVIDEDPDARRSGGLLGVQVHVGPPMKIEYRNVRLKTLDPGSP